MNKQLELKLKKRLLIMEVGQMEEIIDVQPGFNTDKLKGKKFIALKNNQKLICKGSELTEEIAKELVHQSIHTGLFAHYVKDISVNTYCYKSALDSFISAIEAQGYYWKENPIKKPTDYLITQESDAWFMADVLTFNPDKTLIFEIL